MTKADQAFQDWIEQCPDMLKFRLEYIDVRADIENVIQTYEYEFSDDETKQEVIESVLDEFYNQDWADHNNFISYLIDEQIK